MREKQHSHERSTPSAVRARRSVVGTEVPLAVPLAVVPVADGTFELLQIVSADDRGAELCSDLPGAPKVYVPATEFIEPMKTGDYHVVYIFPDNPGGRRSGSARLERYVRRECPPGIKAKDEIDLLLCAQTKMGYKAIVNGVCWGLLYENEVFQDLHYGQKLRGYVKKVRDDGRLDVSLQQPGFQNVYGAAGKVLDHLRVGGGRSRISDSTPPEEIYRVFGISKKQFKIALGHLYKKRIITIGADGIRLAVPDASVAAPAAREYQSERPPHYSDSRPAGRPYRSSSDRPSNRPAGRSAVRHYGGASGKPTGRPSGEALGGPKRGHPGKTK